MDTHSMLMAVQQALVPFYGNKIFGFRLTDKRMAASIGSLCKMFDLAKHGQIERIRRNKDLAGQLLRIYVETPGGLRRVDVLIAEAIRPWVMGLQLNLIAPEKRPLALALKEEAYDALYRALFKSDGEEGAEPATESQGMPPPRIVSDKPGAAPDASWERLFAALQVSQEALRETQEALRDIRQEEQARAAEQARKHRALAGRVVSVEEWLTSLDRQVAALRQGSVAAADQSPALSAAHQADLRTLLRLLAETTGRAQADLAQELIETWSVASLDAIADELWPDVLAWCWWRAQQPQ